MSSRSTAQRCGEIGGCSCICFYRFPGTTAACLSVINALSFPFPQNHASRRRILPRLPALLLSAIIIAPNSLPSAAQSNCPIVVDGVSPTIARTGTDAQNKNPSAKAEGAVRFNREFELTVNLRNVSGKPVRGIKVMPAFYDPAGELHLAPPGIIAFQPFPVAGTVPVHWVTPPPIGADRAVGWLAVIQKVIYEDDARWEFGSATPACFGQWWADA